MSAAGIAVLVHLIDLLSILLRYSGFARIQKAVVDQIGSRSPVAMTFFFFFFGASLALGSAWELFLSLFAFFPHLFARQYLEPDRDQQIGSKLGKEYVKAVYCHPAYLTYMQSTSCENAGLDEA